MLKVPSDNESICLKKRGKQRALRIGQTTVTNKIKRAKERIIDVYWRITVMIIRRSGEQLKRSNLVRVRRYLRTLKLETFSVVINVLLPLPSTSISLVLSFRFCLGLCGLSLS